MTLELFSRDWVPLLSLGVSVLGLGSILLVWWQIRLGTRWNKLQGQEKFLNRHLEETERKMSELLDPLGIQFYHHQDPLTKQQAVQVLEDLSTYAMVKSYLNGFEDLAAAIRIGFVDDDFAFSLEASRMIRTWKVFSPVVQKMRQDLGRDTLYCEMENVADNWKQRQQEERKEREGRVRQIKRSTGAQRKY